MSDLIKKDNFYIGYHIFTNNQDEYMDNKKDALELFNFWKKEYGCARLYEEKRLGSLEGGSDDGGLIEENCIKSFGEYPL